MATVFSGGFPRDSTTGALITVDTSLAVAPTALSGGYLIDANGSIVTTATPTGTGGSGRGKKDGTTGALAAIDTASAVAPTALSGGFLVDATGSLVTVHFASATSPVNSGGFLRDGVTEALVIP